MNTKAQKIFFGSNLKFLRERKGWSQEKLAGQLQVTRAKLAALESGQTRAPQPEDYIKISELFKISIDSLIRIDIGVLGELKLRELEAGNDVYIRGGNLRVLAITVDKENNENVEYVPVKAKAGYTTGYHDPEFIASLPRYSLPNLPRHGSFRVFPITGDSMLPVPGGSEVTAQYIKDWNDIKPDTACILVLRAQQDFVFKLVTLQQEEGFLLRSLNPEYEPYTVPFDEVLEIWRFYSFSTKDLPPSEADTSVILRAIQSLAKKVDKK